MHGIAEAILYFIGLVLAIIGTVALVYALYSLSVKRFSGAVRFYCFVVCIICYGTAAFFMFGYSSGGGESMQAFYSGNYKLNRNGKTYTLDLRKDGTFEMDTLFFSEKNGNWEAEEPDAVVVVLKRGEEEIGRLEARESGDTTLLWFNSYPMVEQDPTFKRW
jgi:hypothetical protein